MQYYRLPKLVPLDYILVSTSTLGWESSSPYCACGFGGIQEPYGLGAERGIRMLERNLVLALQGAAPIRQKIEMSLVDGARK